MKSDDTKHCKLQSLTLKTKKSNKEDDFPGIFLIGDNILVYGNCLYLTTLWHNHHSIIKINLNVESTVEPIHFDSSTSTSLLDIDGTGNLLVKESSHLQPDKLIYFNTEDLKVLL